MRYLGDVPIVQLVHAPVACLVFSARLATQGAALHGLQVGSLIVKPVAVYVADLQPWARLAQLPVHKDGARLFTT